MAQLHNEIRKGFISEAANRAIGRTREGGIERLGETMDPIINLWGMPEWAFLRGEFIWSAWRQQNAVAGQNGYVGIVNSQAGLVANNRNIIIVEEAFVRVATASDVSISLVRYGGVLSLRETNHQACPARDTRWPVGGANVTPMSPARISIGGAAGVLSAAGQRLETLPASGAGIDFRSVPIVLTPDWALIVEHNTVNDNISCVFAGRVRKAFPGELETFQG